MNRDEPTHTLVFLNRYIFENILKILSEIIYDLMYVINFYVIYYITEFLFF